MVPRDSLSPKRDCSPIRFTCSSAAGLGTTHLENVGSERGSAIEVQPDLSEAPHLTLLGPQSRFGGKLVIIRVLCPHIWECGAKGVKELYTSPNNYSSKNQSACPDQEFRGPSLQKTSFFETRLAFGRVWVKEPRHSENILLRGTIVYTGRTKY